jgi:hypothetical protein
VKKALILTVFLAVVLMLAAPAMASAPPVKADPGLAKAGHQTPIMIDKYGNRVKIPRKRLSGERAKQYRRKWVNIARQCAKYKWEKNASGISGRIYASLRCRRDTALKRARYAATRSALAGCLDA